MQDHRQLSPIKRQMGSERLQLCLEASDGPSGFDAPWRVVVVAGGGRGRGEKGGKDFGSKKAAAAAVNPAETHSVAHSEAF